jgi:hypothetical protein
MLDIQTTLFNLEEEYRLSTFFKYPISDQLSKLYTLTIVVITYLPFYIKSSFASGEWGYGQIENKGNWPNKYSSDAWSGIAYHDNIWSSERCSYRI